MANITISENLAEQLRRVAQQQNRSIESILEELLTQSGLVPDAVRTQDNEIQAPEEINYDDDPEWNKSFASSQDFLVRMAQKIRQEYREGRTVELDPDELERDDE